MSFYYYSFLFYCSSSLIFTRTIYRAHDAFILQRYSKSKLNNVSKKLTCCTSAIAVTAFPDEPLIALALVIEPLIELPVLACVSQVLLLIKKNVITHNKNVPFWDVFYYGKITYNTYFLFIITNEITETTNVIIPIIIKETLIIGVLFIPQ